jgi:hypothetical protein
MSFEGPAGLFSRSFQGTFPIGRVRRVMCRHYCPGALPRNMGADRRRHSCLLMLTSVVIRIRILWATLSSCWE